MKDELDRLLDEALKTYCEEPRAGIEQRVMAHVRAADRKPRTWLVWSAGLAAACGLVLLFMSPEHKTVHPPAAVETEALRFIPDSPARVLRITAVPRREPALPKLPRFPSFAPLTDQERLLLALVQRAPEDTKLLADGREHEIEPIQIEDIKIAPLDQDTRQEEKQ